MNLTKPQRSILVLLDGRLSDVELPTPYRRALDNLVGKGLVSYDKGSRYGRTVYNARLTKAGSDFIYNGGIDH